jgi:hypothetical protein
MGGVRPPGGGPGINLAPPAAPGGNPIVPNNPQNAIPH